MTDNLIIDLPELRLPRDLARRVKFIEAVEEHARRLGIVGRYEPSRFIGYYFAGRFPVVVSGHWTVTLEEVPLLRGLRDMVERITERRFSIRSVTEDVTPEFMLVHDGHDGACWLWEYSHGRRFLESRHPVLRAAWEDEENAPEADGSEGPKLLGP